MRRFLTSLLLGFLLVSTFILSVSAQSTGELHIIDRAGDDVTMITDGNLIQLSLETAKAVQQATPIFFYLDTDPQTIGECTIPAGQKGCLTAPFAALGWYWNDDGQIAPARTLYATTLRRNIALGRDDCSDAELHRAIAIAKLDRDLEIFPKGLETMVGERGVTLSGGQKQRATLARALIMDSPVLVLDDCLSSVDAQTEAEILAGLRPFLKEKTCLIISHRISAVKEADEILVLDEGKIIERGDHEALVRRGGVYADLYQQQRLSEELEQI